MKLTPQAVIIWAFASQSVALNVSLPISKFPKVSSLTAIIGQIGRDVGGRFACGVIYGSGCFSTYPGYTALAALTTLPASVSTSQAMRSRSRVPFADTCSPPPQLFGAMVHVRWGRNDYVESAADNSTIDLVPWRYQPHSRQPSPRRRQGEVRP